MPSPPVIRKQTLQQAKKSYKERGRPTLTSQEQRQLDRSIQLDRRAWAVKERERKRAEALKKRQEKQRKDKEESHNVQLGTQVRKDRFGYKSSQMHLGAFFGGGRKGMVEEQENVKVDEMFGDDGVDDESLLDALESPKVTGEPQLERGTVMPPRLMKISPSVRAKVTPIVSADDDLCCFLDDLGSSTQIARELDTAGTTFTDPNAQHKTCNISFDSADFDITAEDLEDILTPSAPARTAEAQNDRALMPPPKLPIKPRAHTVTASPSRAVNRMSSAAKSSSHVPLRPISSGFTMAELESFVDDDLQLTQAAPG